MRQLAAIALVMTVPPASAAPAFTDAAASSGLVSTFTPAAGYPGQHGHMAGGGAVADFNNDGRPDVFLPAGGTAPDRLFINQGPDASGVVTFREEAALWGCDAVHRAGGCAVGDVNRDGYEDLFVVSMGDAPGPASPSANRLYLNNGPDADGDWSFTEAGAASGVRGLVPFVDGMGAAFGDYDLDGDLDLAVCHWSNFAGTVQLLENDGAGRFTSATHLLPDDGFNVRAFQPRFADLTGDRLPELLITGDFSTTVVYFNTSEPGSPGFELRQGDTGIGVDCNAMGSALADLDNDLLLDWYITNIYNPFANSCGNTLYLCDGLDDEGTPVFSELAASRGVRDGGWGWGTAPLDLDHDADLDLAATGGWNTWSPVPSRLYINDGTAHFADRAASAGTAFTGFGRGYVTLDFDDDGDLDLLLIPNGAPARLYENRTPEADANHWLRVDLATVSHPCLAPGGFGTRVYVTAGGVTQVRHIDGAESYLAVGQRTAHFGLGASPVAERVEIRWADGSSTVLADVAADRVVRVPAHHPADLSRDGAVTLDDIAPFAGAFLAGDAAADLTGDAALNFDDIDALVRALAAPCP